jgi:Tol biopolymer transport system component
MRLAAAPEPAGPGELRSLVIGPQYDDMIRPSRPVAAPTSPGQPRPTPGPRGLEGKVALTSEGRNPRVVIYDIRTGVALPSGPTQLWAGPGPPRVSADGNWVVYAGWGNLGKELVLWDAAHGRAVGLPPFARGERSEPDVAAGGRKLIYLEGPARDRRLALFDVALGAETFLTLDDELRRGMRSPTLSADGTTAAFVAASARGDANIHLIDLASGRPIAPPTLNTPDQEQDPALSADGRFLVFSSDRNGTFDLYAYDLDRGEYRPMSALNSLADDSEPRFLGADDRGLAYVSAREGAPTVYARPLEPWR